MSRFLGLEMLFLDPHPPAATPVQPKRVKATFDEPELTKRQRRRLKGKKP